MDGFGGSMGWNGRLRAARPMLYNKDPPAARVTKSALFSPIPPLCPRFTPPNRQFGVPSGGSAHTQAPPATPPDPAPQWPSPARRMPAPPVQGQAPPVLMQGSTARVQGSTARVQGSA